MELKPGYKQTEVGVIPEDWDALELEAVCTMKSGEGITASSIDDFSEYPCYGGNGLRGYTTRFTHDGRFALVGRQGALCGNVVSAQGKFFASEHAVVVTPRAGYDIDYLTYVLGEMHLNRYSESSAQPGLSVSKLLKLPLAAPRSEAEQRSIAMALRNVDALLGELENLIAKRRGIKQAAMQELLTGKRRLPGFEGEWEVKRLGEIATIDPENLGGNTQPNYRFNYISLEDVDQGFLLGWSEQEFSSAPSRARRRLRCMDVLVSTVRPSLKSHLLFCKDSGEWVCSTGFAALRCNSDLVDQSYVYFHLFGDLINKQIEALLTGSNYPAINSRDVRGLEIPVPSLPEQKAIARVLGSMEDEITLLTHQIEKASSLKQGMMQQLLTGKIRLK